jgi:tRNA pseudouridine13 synthase
VSQNADFSLPDWQRAYGGPIFQGLIKQSTSDFNVTEILGYALSGAGEHDFLWIEKEGVNTAWVSAKLAGHAGVREVDVGYSGMKDRQAITRQWFSIRRPTGAGSAWENFSEPGVTILEQTRHEKKLRRGAHNGNHFRIAIREMHAAADAVIERLESIRQGGVPNYFGEQRFGRGGNNLALASALFTGRRLKRNKRSIALSAARAYIFNHILQSRIRDASWNTAVPGEALNLEGTGSVFVEDEINEELQARLLSLDIHPTGVLWGSGELISRDAAAKIDATIAAQFELFGHGLQQQKVKQARRALRLAVHDLKWELEDDTLWLDFWLTSGGFATSVLREIATQATGNDA